MKYTIEFDIPEGKYCGDCQMLTIDQSDEYPVDHCHAFNCDLDVDKNFGRFKCDECLKALKGDEKG